MTSAASTARMRMSRVATVLSASRAKRATRSGRPDTGPFGGALGLTRIRLLVSALGQRASRATPGCWRGAGEETPSKEGSAAPGSASATFDVIRSYRMELGDCKGASFVIAATCFRFRRQPSGANRMACGIDVPNCSVRQKNPILVEAIYSFAERLLKSLVHPIAILGVDALPTMFASR